MKDLLNKIMHKIFPLRECRPIKDWHTNNVLTGNKVYPDIPVTQLGDKLVSIWYCNSLWGRLTFLITGKVNFQIMAPTHAPVAISIGEYDRIYGEKSEYDL